MKFFLLVPGVSWLQDVPGQCPSTSGHPPARLKRTPLRSTTLTSRMNDAMCASCHARRLVTCLHVSMYTMCSASDADTSGLKALIHLLHFQGCRSGTMHAVSYDSGSCMLEKMWCASRLHTGISTHSHERDGLPRWALVLEAVDLQLPATSLCNSHSHIRCVMTMQVHLALPWRARSSLQKHFRICVCTLASSGFGVTHRNGQWLSDAKDKFKPNGGPTDVANQC